MTAQQTPADPPRIRPERTILMASRLTRPSSSFSGSCSSRPRRRWGALATSSPRATRSSPIISASRNRGRLRQHRAADARRRLRLPLDRRQDHRRLAGRACSWRRDWPLRQEPLQRVGDRSRRLSPFEIQAPVASHIDAALIGAALAPVFSEILPGTSIPLALRPRSLWRPAP